MMSRCVFEYGENDDLKIKRHQHATRFHLTVQLDQSRVRWMLTATSAQGVRLIMALAEG